MRIEEIIDGLNSIAREKQAKNAGLPDGWPLDTGLLDDETVLREAIALLKTHPDAQPNEPLALEEIARAEKDERLVVLPLEAKEGDPIPQCFYGDGGLCPGLSAPNDDEPIELCKRCWHCSEGYRQEGKEALRKEDGNG